MKKALLLIIGVIFLFSMQAFAVEKLASPAVSDAKKVNIVKAAKMHATGKVIEISTETMKIERTLKGNMEIMEFILEKPSAGITVNDAVKIEYMEKDGKLTASKVSKLTFKKKEIKSDEEKSGSGKK